MNQTGKRIAFYGKGGIGKSTIAANVSAAMAKSGKRVLHIGCDPKSDSTRILIKRKIPTVLQVLATKGCIDSTDEILFSGSEGVICVEAGGPEAGVGCAGMGIATMLETLETLAVFTMDWDLIVYDVLGDVVCGGFSLPMRKKCVDQIFVVTSAELMSLYAANNIMKSVARYSETGRPLLGGLIHNRAGQKSAAKVVECFAALSKTRLVASVPLSDALRCADYCKATVFEQQEAEHMAAIFLSLSEAIADLPDGMMPQPLADTVMDSLGIQLYAIEREDHDVAATH